MIVGLIAPCAELHAGHRGKGFRERACRGVVEGDGHVFLLWSQRVVGSGSEALSEADLGIH